MSWQETMRKRIPGLTAAEFRWAPGNVVIIDIEDEESAFDLISSIPYRVPVMFEFASSLSQTLYRIVPWDSFDQLIWPGNGAKIVQQKLQLCNKGINVDAKRIGYKDPYVEVSLFKSTGLQPMIIDDVVCTGLTVTETARQGNLTNPALACWVIQYPRQLLSGFSNVWCSLAVRGVDGRVPVNSLSTLLANKDIASDYALRFCVNPDDMLVIRELLA